MKAAPDPRLVEAMSKLVQGKDTMAAELEHTKGAGSDTVAAVIQSALDAIDELLLDTTIPRGTRINLMAMRPALAVQAAVTLRWEELLSTAVVELRSPMGPEDLQRFARSVAYLLPTEEERKAVADRLVAQVQVAMADNQRATQEALALVLAAVPKPGEAEAAARRAEEAARKGAGGAVQKEMALFGAAILRHNKTKSHTAMLIAGAFVVGVLLGIVSTRSWVSYAITEAVSAMAPLPPVRR